MCHCLHIAQKTSILYQNKRNYFFRNKAHSFHVRNIRSASSALNPRADKKVDRAGAGSAHGNPALLSTLPLHPRVVARFARGASGACVDTCCKIAVLLLPREIMHIQRRRKPGVTSATCIATQPKAFRLSSLELGADVLRFFPLNRGQYGSWYKL